MSTDKDLFYARNRPPHPCSKRKFIAFDGLTWKSTTKLSSTPPLIVVTHKVLIVYSIRPLNQLNRPFVPSRSHTRLWGTRKLGSWVNNLHETTSQDTHMLPSTRNTSSGNSPNSGGSFPISLSLKSSSSSFHPGTSLFPLNKSATP